MLTATPDLPADSSPSPDQELVGKVRSSLRALTASFDPKSNQAYTLSLMATLFYDIESALDAGATLKQVHRLLTNQGIPLPYTRFCQNLTRLKQIFPPRKKEPEVDPVLVTKLKVSISELADKHLPPTPEADTPPGALPKEVSRHKARVAKRASTQAPVPAIDKIKTCARAVIDIAQHSDADIAAITNRIRKVLGPNWTPLAACQFIAGSQYAQWMTAPWSKNDKQLVTDARMIVMKLLEGGQRINANGNLHHALNKAWQQIH